MKPLEIQIATHTAIELGPHPLHLDGLLYWCIFNHVQDQDQALSLLDTLLAKRDGIYCASALAFIRTPLQGVTAASNAYPTCIDWREWSLPTDKRSIMELGGPYRARLTKYQAWQSPAVVFHCVGDAKRIAQVLHAIPGIGTNSNHGSGEIRAFDIAHCAQDQSWFCEGKLARILPAALAQDHMATVINTRARPPYTTSPEQECFVPDFRVITRTHTQV